VERACFQSRYGADSLEGKIVVGRIVTVWPGFALMFLSVLE